MAGYTVARSARNIFLYLALMAPAVTLQAEGDALDLFVGRWQIRVIHSQPEAIEVSYTEAYERVLDGSYVRGETGRKPDGSRDIVFATYDPKTEGYPFWIFSSTGSYTYLPPATWNARERVMKWKNSSGFDLSYQSECEFPTKDFRSCFLIMKDWKGKILSKMTWTAQRLPE